jgi:hypothetical protein
MIKLYLDTCIFSPLDDKRETITKEFFKFVSKNSGKYKLVISPITLQEIDNAPEKIRAEINAFLSTIKLIKLQENKLAQELAKDYIKYGILSEKHFEDLLHVAYATLAECDIVISWNRKHLARLITMQKVNKFNLNNNYRMIIIDTPQFILPKEN